MHITSLSALSNTPCGISLSRKQFQGWRTGLVAVTFALLSGGMLLRPQYAAGSASQKQAKSIAAELRLADQYFAGKGVPPNPVQAAYWYRKAADAGDPMAQNQLGYLCLKGIGVEKSDSEAFRWFLRASAGGSSTGKLNLAVAYLQGVGIRSDAALAAALLRQAADSGNPRAAAYLGILYFNGIGVEKDHAIAARWFGRAAAKKDPEGEYAMGRFYSVEPGWNHNLRKADRVLRLSVKSGYVPAMHQLAVLLLQHPELSRDSRHNAMTLLERAAAAGEWRAAETLGILSRNGEGVLRDEAAAFRWFTIAAKQGGAEAERALQDDLARGRSVLSEKEQGRQIGTAELWVRQHPRVGGFESTLGGMLLKHNADPGETGGVPGATD